VSEQEDMAAPVKRGELREELARIQERFAASVDQWLAEKQAQRDWKLDQRFAEQESKLDQRFAEQESKLDQRFAEFEARFEAKFDRKLDLWGGALVDRLQRFEQTMHADFARWAKAIHEALMQTVGVVDDKYKDLPGRVTKLERKVLAPKRTPRR